MTNRLVQHVTVEESTSIQCVKNSFKVNGYIFSGSNSAVFIFCLSSYDQILSFKSMPNFARPKKQEIPNFIPIVKIAENMKVIEKASTTRPITGTG